MLNVLVSSLGGLADAAKSFFSGFGTEAAFLVGIVAVLKIASVFFRNHKDVDWNALRMAAKARSLSEIMSMEWDAYAFLMRYILIKQGYKPVGAMVNELCGIDIVTEKANQRTLFRFGRSTAEKIHPKQVNELLIRRQQLNADNACIVTPGQLSSLAERVLAKSSVVVYGRSDLADWLNEYAGTALDSQLYIGQDSSQTEAPSHVAEVSS